MSHYINSRHEYFITELENVISNIDNLNVLTQYDLLKAESYEYPYAYVDLQDETIEFPYEDNQKYQKGIQEFIIWFGLDVDTDGDLRIIYSDFMLQIEKIFNNLELDKLYADDFTLNETQPRITSVYPTSYFGETKYLFSVSGNISYTLFWD